MLIEASALENDALIAFMVATNSLCSPLGDLATMATACQRYAKFKYSDQSILKKLGVVTKHLVLKHHKPLFAYSEIPCRKSFLNVSVPVNNFG